MTPKPFGLYGIFGFPLGHTLSPAIQEAAFRARGLKAFYLPFEVKPKEFRRLMQGISHLQLDGFNVTVPYKETVLPYLDRLSPSARAIGAVNAVARIGKRWIGYNTDAVGFVRSLEHDAKFRLKGKRILILGAGGSARAVVYAAARRGARQIVIANRTTNRARKVISDYHRLFPRTGFSVSVLNRNRAGAVGNFDLVINATSIGLKPGDPSLVRSSALPKAALFVDLIYRPEMTRFLRLAAQSGHRTMNGAGMLVHQGAEAFRLWTGKQAPIHVMRKELKRALKQK